ncbi:MAG: ComEA family DNA-binding protein [Bacteroidota bacterium]
MLGLTEKQAGSVLKYVSRGGVFHVKSDLRKMRTVPGPIYESWKPYVLLPDTLFKAGKKQSREFTDPVDLNTADSTALDRLRGIGPFMASRIVHYRDALGGFVHSNQMKEVYGMTDSLCIALLDQSNIKSELPIRTLGLNSTPWDSLKRHPYIGFKLAGMIDRYRKQHPFQDINELMSVPLVTPEIFRKLAPYLTVR